MRMEHRAPCTHIFCSYTHPRPLGYGHIIFLLKVLMFYIKLLGMQGHILSFHTPLNPVVGSKKFTGISHVAYQINKNGS